MFSDAFRTDRARRRAKAVRVSAAAAGAVAAVLIAGCASSNTPTGAAPSAGTVQPKAAGDTALTETRQVSGTFDGHDARFVGAGALGGSGQEEGQDPLFELADGAVLKNVVLGAPAADGVHCLGSCTLQNVTWEDVGEDAATFLGKSPDATYLVEGGSAAKADDKVLQFNGAGTLTVRNFAVSDFGKLVRSCGNCSTQFQRNVVLDTVKVTGPGKDIVGINSNLGDTAKLSGITITGDPGGKIVPCQKFEGVTSGEPKELGSDADGKNCVFSEADIVRQ
ncbi:pectate lyase [Streptomyces sp. NPDC004542]|uniref:pectate lyase n=1 Tax=Streptomyces sp. NPDC004542 TaxID=3154281 RepID=UPI0033AFDEE2